MKRSLLGAFLAAAALLAMPHLAAAQGVTTGAIRGFVSDQSGAAIEGARVTAVHEPSGTTYQTSTRADGRLALPGMRVGGPYRVTVVAIGYESQVRENVYVSLGVSADLNFTMQAVAVTLDEITVTGERNSIFSSERTGAATSVTREAIERLPTVTGSINDYVRITPQVRGQSFVGQDSRLNNITVDGSYFNNSFGLGSGASPGGRTGVAPISMAAIEQVQVSMAPYDVRQGNFVGAGVNTVTRSGTNEVTGSLFYSFRDDGLVGKEAGSLAFDPGNFSFSRIGGTIGGPIVKDKLFFFLSAEHDGFTEPGTTFLANTGGQTPEGNITRVLKSDLDALSSFLATNFNYTTGGYEGYDHSTPATRVLAKLDYNLDAKNKLSLRYSHLDSETDVLMSNSSSLGFGGRRTRTDALNFQNSNYTILENIRSIVGEWNSIVGDNMSNNLIIGYTNQDESRGAIPAENFFPMVDILKDGATYTSFGAEPFTPNNELRYKTFQLQNNFTIYGAKHDLTFGASLERYESENVFFPGSQSVYVYNSLQNFYDDANGYLANPNRTTSPVTLRRFQVRWSNIPDLEKPVQPLKVWYAGVFAQDEWRVNQKLTVTAGLRVDVPKFGNTGFANSEVDGFTFRDETGASVKYATDHLPDANLLFSPRLGFNYDLTGDRSTQIRGGTGIFSGRPAYVWISNQVGNNGVLTGFERLDNTTARPFNPDPNRYKPASVTGAPAASYELAFTDPGFKFPQVWRSNIAVDRKLPWDLVATGEFLYSRDVNGIYYINANLAAPNSALTGPDNRPRWVGSNRIISKVDNAVTLKNQNEGYSWNVAASLEKQFSEGLFAKVAYNYGVSKNTVDPGSIAFGSWNNNPHPGNPNLPPLAYSSNSPGTRVFGLISYQREFFRSAPFGATTISLVYDAYTQGNASYTANGDVNGDGGTSNDLIYIPRDQSEMNFETYTSSGTTFTADQQAAAFEAYIQQDEYLRNHRGQYAERGAVFMPMVRRADVSLSQDFYTMVGGKRNRIQFRVDILNVGNLIKKDWGVGDRFVSTQPLIFRSVDGTGKARYRFRNVGTNLMSKTFEKTSGLSDVYTVQFSFKYFFN